LRDFKFAEEERIANHKQTVAKLRKKKLIESNVGHKEKEERGEKR